MTPAKLSRIKGALAAVILAAVASAPALATDQTEHNDKRAVSFATELQVNPFNDDYTFRLDALRLRCFLTDRHVVSADFGFNILSKKEVGNTGFKHRWDSHTNGSVKFNLGYEYVYVRYKRLNLYVGAKAGYERRFASSTQSFDSDRKVVYSNYDEVDDIGAANIFNAAIYTGLDFYVYKGLYLGVEFGVYLSDAIPVKQIRKTYSEGNYSENFRNIGGHELKLSTSASPLLRLGWRF